MSDSLAATTLFSATHQWVRPLSTTRVQVGISDFAQEALGDVVFIEAPALDTSVRAGELIGAIESVKTASEILAPVSGRLVAFHALLEDQPEQVNEAPIATWIYELEVDPEQYAEEAAQLMTAADYQAQLD